jgi:hypothetical protein
MLKNNINTDANTVMDMQHGQGRATSIRTCSMDMDMQHGHGHAAWTWTCSIDVNTVQEVEHCEKLVCLFR